MLPLSLPHGVFLGQQLKDIPVQTTFQGVFAAVH